MPARGDHETSGPQPCDEAAFRRRAPRLLTRDAYFAPAPIVRRLGNGHVVDANIAARLLGIERVPSVTSDFGPATQHGTTAALRFLGQELEFRIHRVADVGTRRFDETAVTEYWTPLRPDRLGEFERGLAARQSEEIYWELYSRSYDIILPRLSFYARSLERHRELILATSPQRVLDIGGGTGTLALRLCRDGVSVVLVDLSRAMLGVLTDRIDPANAASLSVLEHDAQSLPMFRDGEFDCVNILLALYAIEDPRSALGEAVRVLCDGRRLVVTEPRRGFDLDELYAIAEQELGNLAEDAELRDHWQRVRMVNDALTPVKREGRLFAEDIASVLEELGMELEMVLDSHYGQCATVAARKRTTSANGSDR